MYPVHGKCFLPETKNNQPFFKIRGSDNSETINKTYIDKQYKVHHVFRAQMPVITMHLHVKSNIYRLRNY